MDAAQTLGIWKTGFAKAELPGYILKPESQSQNINKTHVSTNSHKCKLTENMNYRVWSSKLNLYVKLN